MYETLSQCPGPEAFLINWGGEPHTLHVTSPLFAVLLELKKMPVSDMNPYFIRSLLKKKNPSTEYDPP